MSSDSARSEPLRSVDADDEPAARRPSLNRLREEQRESLRRFREEGFESRRRLLIWLHEFQFRTLGKVADWVFFLLPTQDVTLSCCLTNSHARARHHPRSFLDDANRREERQRQAARHLRPACRKALRELRTQANEFVDGDDDPAPDPDASPYAVLRPSFEEYHDRQRRRLEDWLDGFDSLAGLEDWLHDFDYDTLGEITQIPGGEEFDFEVLEKRATRRVALGDREVDRMEREQLAARYLLPTTNRAVRELAVSAGEAVEEESDGIHIPTG